MRKVVELGNCGGITVEAKMYKNIVMILVQRMLATPKDREVKTENLEGGVKETRMRYGVWNIARNVGSKSRKDTHGERGREEEHWHEFRMMLGMEGIRATECDIEGKRLQSRGNKNFF